MRTYSIATAPNMRSRHWQPDTKTWPEFLAWLDLDNPATEKDCGGYVLGVLRETDTQHVKPDGTRDGSPCTALHRNKTAVVSRSAAALDADTASASFVADSAAALDCGLAFYTTWSHTPEKPRWRLLVPLSRDVDPDEYRLIVGALMIELGFDQFDTGSPQPERLMHRPSSQGSDYQHFVVDGEPLDADEWLARAKESGLQETETPSAEPYHDDSPQRPAGEGLHPYAARSIADELARLDDCAVLGWGGEPWDNTTFAVACNLVEFANSNWSGYSLADAEADLFAHAPADEEWGAKQHAAKWLSALSKVDGGGRPSPRSTAEDDFAEPLLLDATKPAEPGLLARFQRMDMAELLNPDRPPREYVVEPMIAAGTSVAFVAPAGHRKSLVLLGLALAVARGSDDFAGMTIPRARRVCYVDMENTEDDLRERLLSFGVSADEDLSRFILVSLPNMLPLDTATGGEEFRQAVQAFGLEPGDLVVLDSYQRVTEAGENDSDTTRGYYRHTGVHLKALGLTVIRTDNTGKDASRGARGSSGKRDDVDVEYLLKSEGDYVEVNTGKVRQRGISKLLLTVTTDANGRTTFRSDMEPPATTKMRECVALLDGLGVPDDAGQRKAQAALENDGQEVPRAIVRDAVKVRQNRAASARRAFSDEGLDDGSETAPNNDGAVRRGAGSPT